MSVTGLPVRMGAIVRTVSILTHVNVLLVMKGFTVRQVSNGTCHGYSLNC